MRCVIAQFISKESGRVNNITQFHVLVLDCIRYVSSESGNIHQMLIKVTMNTGISRVLPNLFGLRYFRNVTMTSVKQKKLVMAPNKFKG